MTTISRLAMETAAMGMMGYPFLAPSPIMKATIHWPLTGHFCCFEWRNERKEWSDGKKWKKQNFVKAKKEGRKVHDNTTPHNTHKAGRQQKWHVAAKEGGPKAEAIATKTKGSKLVVRRVKNKEITRWLMVTDGGSLGLVSAYVATDLFENDWGNIFARISTMKSWLLRVWWLLQMTILN